MSLYQHRIGSTPFYLSFEIVLGTADTKYFPIPGASDKEFKLGTAYTATDAALTTADETVVIKNGATSLGTITITQSGSAAGDVDSADCSTNASSTFAGGSAVTVTIGGENGSATTATLVLEIIPQN